MDVPEAINILPAVNMQPWPFISRIIYYAGMEDLTTLAKEVKDFLLVVASGEYCAWVFIPWLISFLPQPH